MQDLSLADNALPEGVKGGLINLGLWAMRYSTLAMLKDLPLEPLIAVNRNVAEGLQAQPIANPTPAANAGAIFDAPISA